MTETLEKTGINQPPEAEKPTRAARKRTKGRDRPDSSFTPDPSSIPDLPSPPARQTRDAGKFFSYWSRLDHDQPDRIVAYVYRLFPIIDREILGKTKNIAIIPACPGPDKMAFYAEMGCGDYRIFLNDGMKRNKTICTLLLVEGFRDLDNYPPEIELEDIVLNDPGNAVYIQKMRMKGVNFPGLGEDDDMMPNQTGSGSATAISTLVEAVKDLSLSQINQPRPPSLDGEVSARTMDTFSKSVSMANEILGNAYKKASDINVKQQTAQTTPMEMTNAVIAAAKAMQPEPSTQPQLDITGLLTVFQSMGASQVAAITKASEDRVAGMKDSMDSVIRLYESQAKTRSETPAVDPLKNLKDTLSVISDVKAVTGGGESNPENPWVSLAQAALAGLPHIIALATTVVTTLSANRYNEAVSRTGQGNPLPPPQPPATAPETTSPDQAYQQFLQQIAAPLLNHLASEELDGVDFAKWLIDSQSHGRLMYDQMKEKGGEKIVGMIQESHPQLYAELQKVPVKFEVFLTEFLEYDVRIAQDDDKEAV